MSDPLFDYLADEWECVTMNVSNPNAIASHPCVQRIIAEFGAAAVPMILSRMKDHPWFWFRALSKLTGENPVTPAMHGNMRKMTDAWIKWGEEHFPDAA